MTRKHWLIATLGLAAALGAGSAMARADVQWSVTIGAPVYPVYSPPPVYPVYAPPPVIVAPAYPVYGPPVYGPPVYVAAPAYRHHHHYRPTYWDRDGDGIPNRYDRYDDRRYDDRRWDRPGR
jgi:hypothetical protein